MALSTVGDGGILEIRLETKRLLSAVERVWVYVCVL